MTSKWLIAWSIRNVDRKRVCCDFMLKDKSGVGIIVVVDYSDYTVANGVLNFFQFFSLLICETTYFNLLRSAK